VAHATAPALYADNRVAFVQNAELDCVHDAVLQAAVDVFLPGDGLEVGLLFVEVEGIDAAVEMRVLWVTGLVYACRREDYYSRVRQRRCG
jgi:hypothetical protein